MITGRLGGLASLGPLDARLLERKLDKDQGRRLGGLASLGTLGARLFERSFEASFSHGYQQLQERKRAQRRTKIKQKATGGNRRQL